MSNKYTNTLKHPSKMKITLPMLGSPVRDSMLLSVFKCESTRELIIEKLGDGPEKHTFMFGEWCPAVSSKAVVFSDDLDDCNSYVIDLAGHSYTYTGNPEDFGTHGFFGLLSLAHVHPIGAMAAMVQVDDDEPMMVIDFVFKYPQYCPFLKTMTFGFCDSDVLTDTDIRTAVDNYIKQQG